MPHPYCTWPGQGNIDVVVEEWKRGGGGQLEKRGLIIISNRVPEHPRFTGLTHVRTPPRGHVREGFRVLRIETWGWNFNWSIELTVLNFPSYLRKKKKYFEYYFDGSTF